MRRAVGEEVGGGGRKARVGTLMRVMGALKTVGGWCFQARRVTGVENRLADE